MTTEELLMKYENQWVFLSKEQIDYMLDEILPPLPQQEISDEEIEKAAMKTMDYVHLNPNDSLLFHQGWMRAIKWYREQLKTKKD